MLESIRTVGRAFRKIGGLTNRCVRWISAAFKYFSVRTLSDIAALGLCGVVVAIAAFPVGTLFYSLRPLLVGPTLLRTASAWALLVGGGYIVFGVSVLLVIVVLRRLLFLRSKEEMFEVNCLETMRFALFHGLFNPAPIFVLPLIRGTSLINAFYRGMGATIGKRTLINTVLISDCNLVTIGDDCLVGGDSVINGHSAEHGVVILQRVSIGNRVTIGQYATILPGVRIEDDVIVAANSLVPKFRRLAAGRIYAGVPARYSGMSSSVNPECQRVVPQPVGAATHSVAADGFILARSEVNVQQILLESYKMRHAEVLDIIRFMSQVTVSSLGLLVTSFLYSVTNQQPRILLFLPPLAGLTYAILLNAAIAMQRLGMKACEIEIIFQQARVAGFDWEMKYGSLGSARVFDLDAILIQFVLLGTLLTGSAITWKGYIVMSTVNFLGYTVQNILLAVDLFIGSWIVLSVIYLLARRWSMKAALRRKL